MPKTIPTVGDGVLYKPTEEEKQAMKDSPACNVSETLPAVVVADWGSETINVKVFHDGDLPDLWKTSILRGDQPGEWLWPWEVHV